MRIRLSLLLALLFTAGAVYASAQYTSADYYGAQVIDVTNQGGAFPGPGQKGLAYTHDLSTGAVSLHLAPWGVIKSARGPAIPFALVFSYSESLTEENGDPPYVNYLWQVNGPPSLDQGVNPNTLWSETTPSVVSSWAAFYGQEGEQGMGPYDDECDQTAPYTFTGFDGIGHDLGLADIYDQLNAEYGGNPQQSSVCPGREYTSGEDQNGIGLYSQFAPGTNQVQYVSQPDGTRYYFDTNTPQRLIKIEDANGNYVTVTGTTGAGPEIWTDAAGKQVLEVYRAQYGGSSGPWLPVSIYTLDSAGNQQVYSASWTYEQSTNYPLANPTNICEYCTVSEVPAVRAYELTSLSLPDGSSYSIGYDATTGAVAKISYPTGGYVQFAYGDAPNPANCTVSNTESHPCDQLAATDEWRNDGVNTSHWTYAYSSGQYQSEIVTVKDPAGQPTTYNYAAEWESGASGAESELPLETQRTVAAANGSPLRITTTQYYAFRPIAVQTQLADAGSAGPLASEADYSFDYVGNLLEEDDHDYAACSAPAPPWNPNAAFGCGPGTLLKKTTRTFLSDTDQWIVNKPLTETISDGSDNPKSQTTWEYDVYSGTNHAALTASGAVNQDPTYAAGAGFTTRGNPTAISRCATFSGANCTQWLTSYAQYDDAGNRILDVDPAGNPTHYYFNDAWANTACAPSGGQSASFLTKIVNALNQTTTATYNSCSGTVATLTDPNSQTTAYSYADPFNRVTDIKYPDCTNGICGETTFAYTPTTMETKRAIDGTRWTDSIETLDGLARKIVTASANGEATPWDRLDTCYNGDGEVSFTAYPFQSTTSGGTPNCAGTGDSFLYDALGRETQTTHSDGTTFLTTYAGRATETQDEGNGTNRVTRISQTDGLGYLSSVCEVTSTTLWPNSTTSNVPAACGRDIAATGFLTTYQHDILGNLTNVSQGSLQARSFVHDGLSRLLSASNPETGTTNYTYDADSNVRTRTRPAPNQTDPTVTVTTYYTWDALNRLLQTYYADGTTPAAGYTYDQATGLGTTFSNPIGRLTTELAANAVEGFGYDQMGRRNFTTQAPPSVYGIMGFVNYAQFDAAGELIWDHSTYNSGATFTRTYNLAGELTSIYSTVSGQIISGTAYNARHQLLVATLGNVENETRAYDARGRINAINDGSDYSYSVPANGYAPDSDVLTSTDSVIGGFQNTFNDLNQLTQAVDAPNCPGNPCYAAYSYDRYGNRWSEQNNFSTPVTPENATVNGGNNRLDGYLYDAAGNLLNDGMHTYAYDAENRIISVDAGATATYVYNAEGRRVHENVGGTVKEYIYGMGLIDLSVVDGNQNLVQEETHWDGRYLGTVTPTGIAWAYTDALGTVRKRSNGEINSNWPFGEFSNIQNGTSQIHFTGKLKDTETDLDYFGARYYNSTLGRFLTPDWSPTPEPVPYADLENPQSLNLYSYVGNNPVTSTDPDGHIWPSLNWLPNAYNWLNASLSGTGPAPPPPMPSAPPAPPLAVLTTSINGNTTTFQSSTGDGNYSEVKIRSLVLMDSHAKPGAGGPFVSTVVGVSNRHAGDVSYGPAGAFIDTGDSRGQDLHGGGHSLGLAHAFDPYQRLTPTMGCTRACNADVQRVGAAITAFQRQFPLIPITSLRIWQ